MQKPVPGVINAETNELAWNYDSNHLAETLQDYTYSRRHHTIKDFMVAVRFDSFNNLQDIAGSRKISHMAIGQGPITYHDNVIFLENPNAVWIICRFIDIEQLVDFIQTAGYMIIATEPEEFWNIHYQIARKD